METHVTKKAIFMNGQKRSQNSIETINTKKHLQQKIIKRAQPLVLKRKSLNGIDTSYNNIEKMYLAAIEKIQKSLQKEVIAMKQKPADEQDQERLALILEVTMKA